GEAFERAPVLPLPGLVRLAVRFDRPADEREHGVRRVAMGKRGRVGGYAADSAARDTWKKSAVTRPGSGRKPSAIASASAPSMPLMNPDLRYWPRPRGSMSSILRCTST